MPGSPFLNGFGQTMRSRSLRAGFSYEFASDVPARNFGMANIPPYYIASQNANDNQNANQLSLVGKFFEPGNGSGWTALDGLYRASESFGLLTFENSSLETIRIVQSWDGSSIFLRDSSNQFVQKPWIPSDEFFSAAERIASISSVFFWLPYSSVPSPTDRVAIGQGKAFICAPKKRRALILLADVSGSKTLAAPWVAVSLCEFGFLPSGVPPSGGTTVGTRIPAETAFLPISAISVMTLRDTVGTTVDYDIPYGYATQSLCIECVGQQTTDSRMIVLRNQQVWYSQVANDSFRYAFRSKAVLNKKSDNNQIYATALEGCDIGISGWTRIYTGQSASDIPVALHLLSAYRVKESSSQVTESFAQKDYVRNVSFFHFSTLSAPAPHASQSMGLAGLSCRTADSARLSSSPVSAAASTAIGAIDGKSMGEWKNFDFGATCARSFFSAALNLATGPQPAATSGIRTLNSESIIGFGNILVNSEHAENIPSNQLRNYKKAPPAKSYQVKTEATFDTAPLVSEAVSYVELLSSAMIASQPPFQDTDVAFPIIQSGEQGTSFVFRGKKITSCGIQFVPWSSNSFFESVGASTTQQTAPQITLYPGGGGVSQPIYISTNDGLDPGWTGKAFVISVDGFPASVVETELAFQQAAGGIFTNYFLYRTTWSQVQSRPLPSQTYYPNQSFDESSYMAGCIARLLPSPVGLGVIPSGQTWNAKYGFRESQFTSRNPLESGLAGYSTSSLNSIYVNHRYLCYPSLAGKEFICSPDSVLESPLQAGAFHFLGEGSSFQKSVTLAFQGKRTREQGTSQQYTFTETPWGGSETHDMTFKTQTVEVYIKWSASLQSPGPYSVSPPYPATFDDVNVESGPSIVAPRMFVKTSRVQDVTPILVAEVWVRSVGSVEMSSAYTFPEVFGTSGTFPQKSQVTNIGPTVDSSVTINIENARFGHNGHVVEKDIDVPTSIIRFRYLGAMPFNREQTQRLLDGEEVEPTFWFLDDEGTAVESQPICVAWHNATFGTYKLKFRLITE